MPKGEDKYGNPQSGDFATVLTDVAELVLRKRARSCHLGNGEPYNVGIRSYTASRETTPASRAVDAHMLAMCLRFTQSPIMMGLNSKLIGPEALSKRLNEIAPNVENCAAEGVGRGGGGSMSCLSVAAFAGSDLTR